MPVKRREVIRRLRHFGVRENVKRGKGGHRLLVSNVGLSYPLKFHGDNQDLPDSIVKSICRHFSIDYEDFVAGL